MPAPENGNSSQDSPADGHSLTIGRYKVESEVAQGGMAIVYRVHDAELDRTLAMKVMTATGQDSSSAKIELARFLEEAQVTAQLDHPGIVPVHEAGCDAEGKPFFTMKLVKGRTLSEVFGLAREEKEGWNVWRAVGVMVKARPGGRVCARERRESSRPQAGKHYGRPAGRGVCDGLGAGQSERQGRSA